MHLDFATLLFPACLHVYKDSKNITSDFAAEGIASWPAGDTSYSVEVDTAVPFNATTLHAVAAGGPRQTYRYCCFRTFINDSFSYDHHYF